jgi:hypothetical protein
MFLCCGNLENLSGKVEKELFASDDIQEIAADVEKLSDQDFDKLACEVFRGPKTAAELVAEGRGR